MKEELMIKIPARKSLQSTMIFVVLHTLSAELGQRPVMIMIPGGPGNDHTMYDIEHNSFVEALLPFVDIVIFDPRGCGKSQASPIEDCTLEYYIEDVECIRQYFNITNRRLYMLGASYGAICALGYATKYSHYLGKLVLLCGAAGKDFIPEAIQNLIKVGTDKQKYEGMNALEGNLTNDPNQYHEYYQAMGPLYSYKFQSDTPTPPLTNIALTNFGFSSFLRAFDYRQVLSSIECPALIIAGNDDWLATKHQATIIHQGIVGSQLICYENCKHLIWIDQWDKCISDIKSFLSS